MRDADKAPAGADGFAPRPKVAFQEAADRA